MKMREFIDPSRTWASGPSGDLRPLAPGVPSAAVIVAHPSDETLWSGGFILQRPNWDWFILTLCRSPDSDRIAAFSPVLRYLGAEGIMAELDDGTRGRLLNQAAVRHAIREGLPQQSYDLVLTHAGQGERTGSRRQEACSQAVGSLVRDGHLVARRFMHFSYDDSNDQRLPRAKATADERYELDPDILGRKRHIISELYGFGAESWQAKVMPDVEGFSHVENLGRQPDASSRMRMTAQADSLGIGGAEVVRRT